MTNVTSNLEVAYHGVTWETTEFIEGVKAVYEPDINLVCLFDRLPDDTLYYDVTWYVDDTEILSHQTVTSNHSDLALLKGTQIFAKGKKANSMVIPFISDHVYDNAIYAELALILCHHFKYFFCNTRYSPYLPPP